PIFGNDPRKGAVDAEAGAGPGNETVENRHVSMGDDVDRDLPVRNGRGAGSGRDHVDLVAALGQFPRHVASIRSDTAVTRNPRVSRGKVTNSQLFVHSHCSNGAMAPRRRSMRVSDPTPLTSSASALSTRSNCGPAGLLIATRT